MTRDFHLKDILSVMTGILIGSKISDLYDILAFISDDNNLYTHQLPRVARECRPYLLKEMPWLVEIDASSVNKENMSKWLKCQVQKYGEYHKVSQMPVGCHKKIDPIDDFYTLFGGD